MPCVVTQISANGINVLDWPGNSPDLNAIEEVWNVMKKKCGSLEKNKMELWKGVCRALYSVSRQKADEMVRRNARKGYGSIQSQRRFQC